MNLGHISSTSAPFVKVDSSICFFLLCVCFDMNAMYCILKGFSLYNFGNKFVFIVIVIVKKTPHTSPWHRECFAGSWQRCNGTTLCIYFLQNGCLHGVRDASFVCDLSQFLTAWRLVLSMKPWSYIWLEIGLFSTIIAIIRACAYWALFVVTLTNTVHLIYIYI